MLEPIIYSSLAWINNRLFSITPTTWRLNSLLTCFSFNSYITQTPRRHRACGSELFDVQSEQEYWVTQIAKQNSAVLSYGCSAFPQDRSHHLKFCCLQEKGSRQTLIQKIQQKNPNDNTAAHGVVANSNANRQEMSNTVSFKRSQDLQSSQFDFSNRDNCLVFSLVMAAVMAAGVDACCKSIKEPGKWMKRHKQVIFNTFMQLRVCCRLVQRQ